MTDQTRGQFWTKDPALAWREIDGKTVIISPSDSVMHELNETGSFLWKRLDGKHSVAELAALLTEEYDVGPQVALADTEALLDQLAAQKLLIPEAAAPGEASPR